MVLWEDDGATLSQTGDRLGLDSPTMSPLVERLEKLGLVVRRRGTLTSAPSTCS